MITANPDGTVTYDPAGRFDYLKWGEVAYDQFDYVVSDAHGATDRGTATVTILRPEQSRANRRKL